jgi:hypothetical protein
MLNPSVFLSASAATGWNEYAWPTVTAVDGVPLIVGARFAELPTVIENGGNVAAKEPSVAVITMLVYVPTLDVLGVPDNLPVNRSNEAQPGLWLMLKRSGSPFGSLADGVKLYALPGATEVAGDPEIVGPPLSREVTRIENQIDELLFVPSLTRIRMPVHRPTLDGVPVSAPLLELNVAHAGRLKIWYVSLAPSGSRAVGWKEYGEPTYTQLAGVPEIVGG